MTGHSNDLIEKVLHFELDGAFVHSPVTHPDIVEEFLIHEELVLVTAKSETSPNCVHDKPILMNTTGCLYRGQIEDWLKVEGITRPRVMEFSTMDAIIGGVIADLGFSLIPKSSIQSMEEVGLVNTFPVPSPYRSVNTGFIRHREALLTSTLMKFVELLRETSVASNVP